MEIDDELEPLTVYNYEVSPPMHNLVKHVLKAVLLGCGWCGDSY